MRHRRLWVACAAVFSALIASRVQAEDAPKAEKKSKEVFLRVLRDDKKEPIALQTSIATYVPAGEKNKGVTVDLVGAVHVGDKEYYQELNKAFEQYDALLFELVAPEGTKIPKGGRRESANPVSGLQRGMQTMLELEFQLDQIDYTKPNFVHADMSPEEFSKSMSEKNESMLGMMFRMMGQGAKIQANGGASDAEMLFAMFAKDRAARLKRAMAVQFESLDGQMAALEGKTGSTIIAERNKKALQVLNREIDGGKKKIGIFYGAGHLVDMHNRLVSEDFGLKKESEKWITAWKMEPAKKEKREEKKKEEM